MTAGGVAQQVVLMKMPDLKPLASFQRVVYDKRFVITIWFKGELEGKPGVWYGVEWDDWEEKGKHSGAFEGRQYFVPRLPNSSSFIKESSTFHVRLETGVEFGIAFEKKYLEPELEEGSNFLTLGDTNIRVETVGFEKTHRKQTNLELLTELGLADCNISHFDDSSRELCEKLKGLLARLLPAVISGCIHRFA